MSTRAELLIDLADSINELTKPRQNTEPLEAWVTRPVVSRSGKIREKRTRERRQHVVTFPSLLDELRAAAIPGSGDAGAATGGFESRPSAELEPLAVFREIDHDAGFWARTFQVERDDLAGVLHALVGAPHDDPQLAEIARQAARWVHRAKVATGHEPPPVTLNQPCPLCGRKAALVVTADLQTAHCTRCMSRWTAYTIGLLTEMIKANEDNEVLALERCWMVDCRKYGDHAAHEDTRGRTWRDTCELSAPDETMSA